MIKWLKKQLGIEELQNQLTALNTERAQIGLRLVVEQRERAEERELLTKQVAEEQQAKQQLDEQLQVFRKKEEQDKAKYDSKDPWVEIRSADFSDVRGFRIELDWNDAFIEHLKGSGIKGANEEEIIQKWLAFLYQNLIERLEAKSIDRKDEEKTVSDYV
jgi:hypothetical protein